MEGTHFNFDFPENTTFFNYTTTFSPYYSTEEDTDVVSKVFRVIQVITVIFYTISFVIGIFGNGLVIWIAGFKMKKTVNVLWSLNLAIADIVFNIIFPLQVTELIMDGHWPFGRMICKVIFTILFLNASVSTFFLMIISVDQCTLVMCPMWSRKHRTLKVGLIISAITWSTCFMLSSPYLVFSDVIHDLEGDISYCIPVYEDDNDVDTRRNRTMMIISFVSLSLIPCSITLICNGLVKFRLRRSSRLSRSKRPIKIIITILFSILCFWFPFQIWSFLEILNVELNDTVGFIMSHLLYFIGVFSSCLNPMVYVFIGRNFKKSFFKSIPFLLENSLRENDDSDTEYSYCQMETEIENYDL
ncbi:formyl peptide receptor-related sequence 4-like [Rhinoderma darwinii]|uniref:formyl peptide receptor-related sequence 4-like n=1 Tax=Rhinoderma darwinii TaxID=43563 RepID=UPI003F67F6B2